MTDYYGDMKAVCYCTLFKILLLPKGDTVSKASASSKGEDRPLLKEGESFISSCHSREK